MSFEPLLGKYVPLKTVVSYFMDQYEKSEGDQDKYWILGLRGLVELHLDISGEPKTVRLPLNGNFTVNFPSDCITWTKIGILNEAGEVSTLKINSGLTTLKDTNPNRLNYLTPDINDSALALATAPFFANYYYDNGYFNLFGVGGGLIQYGECRVDDANQLIILSPQFRFDSILFEYISSPEKDEDYMIPLVLQEAVIAFIEWKAKLNTPQNFYGEAIKARRRLSGKKVTLQGINQVVRESETMKLRS